MDGPCYSALRGKTGFVFYYHHFLGNMAFAALSIFFLREGGMSFCLRWDAGVLICGWASPLLITEETCFVVGQFLSSFFVFGSVVVSLVYLLLADFGASSFYSR